MFKLSQMPEGMEFNKDKDKVQNMLVAIATKTEGQCPCVPKYARTEDTMCPCKEAREQNECRCGLLQKKVSE